MYNIVEISISYRYFFSKNIVWKMKFLYVNKKFESSKLLISDQISKHRKKFKIKFLEKFLWKSESSIFGIEFYHCFKNIYAWKWNHFINKCLFFFNVQIFNSTLVFYISQLVQTQGCYFSQFWPWKNWKSFGC